MSPKALKHVARTEYTSHLVTSMISLSESLEVKTRNIEDKMRNM